MKLKDKIQKAGWEFKVDTQHFPETCSVVAVIMVHVPPSQKYKRISHPFRVSFVEMLDTETNLGDWETGYARVYVENRAWEQMEKTAGRYITAALSEMR